MKHRFALLIGGEHGYPPPGAVGIAKRRQEPSQKSCRPWLRPRPNRARPASAGRARAHKLEDVSPATDGVSQCPEDHEDETDQENDDADRPNDGAAAMKPTIRRTMPRMIMVSRNLRGELLAQCQPCQPTLSKVNS